MLSVLLRVLGCEVRLHSWLVETACINWCARRFFGCCKFCPFYAHPKSCFFKRKNLSPEEYWRRKTDDVVMPSNPVGSGEDAENPVFEEEGTKPAVGGLLANSDRQTSTDLGDDT